MDLGTGIRKPTWDDLLRAAIDRTSSMLSVPFCRRTPLCGTQNPRGPIRVNSDSGRATRPGRAPRHVSASMLIYDVASLHQRDLQVLVDQLRQGCRELGADLFEAQPLPHVPEACEWIAYYPVMIDGGYARVIMSYSHMDQAFLMSVDALPLEASARRTLIPVRCR
jgi:hypothetical protein